MNAIAPFLLLFAPVPFFIVYASVQQRRRNRKAAAAALLPPEPFAPKPEPTPNAFLGRFNPAERNFLRVQWGTALAGFCTVVWVFTVLFSTSLLPGSINYFGVAERTPFAVWYSFLHNAVLTSSAGWFCGIVTALTANAGILGSMKLNLTRPVPRGVLFWGRTATALLTLLAGYVTALALSFVLLLLFYGSVWKHVDYATAVNEPTAAASASTDTVSTGAPVPKHVDDVSAAAITAAALDDADPETPQQLDLLHRRWLARTSPSRVFLSTATNMLLAFAFFVALFAQPWRSGRKVGSGAGLALAGPAVVFCLVVRHLYDLTGTSKYILALFIYGADSAPPPWHFALVPIILSALMLLAARAMFSRAEI